MPSERKGHRGHKIIDVRDYGLSVGGPFSGTRSGGGFLSRAGHQDHDHPVDARRQPPDEHQLQVQPAAPAPEQDGNVPGLRQEEKWGRGASYSTPFGTHQTNNYHFGNPVVKIQDEHMFGTISSFPQNSTLSLGFYMKSMMNENGDLIGLYNVTDASQ